MEKKLIWTSFYNAWSLGGTPNFNAGAEVEVSGPFDIGQGFQVGVWPAPDGTTRVVEWSSGAIVGYTIEEVTEDLTGGDVELAKKQVAGALAALENVRKWDPDKFWNEYKQ